MRCTSGWWRWGFAPCEALWWRVAGVSEAWMASFPPIGGSEDALFDVRPEISHVIPLRVFQVLKAYRWDCNVCGVSRKMTMLNYVRLWGRYPARPRLGAVRRAVFGAVGSRSRAPLPGPAPGPRSRAPLPGPAPGPGSWSQTAQSQLVTPRSRQPGRQSQFSSAT